jgi:hypothetical protein
VTISKNAVKRLASGGRDGPDTGQPAVNRAAKPCRRPFGFPGAGGPVEGEHLHPGQQFAGHRDQLGPDLVLVKAVQWQVAQPGVFGVADAVFAPGAAAVA